RRSEPAAPGMAPARQVLCLCVFLCVPLARSQPIRYSVPEESESGSVVAHVAQDVGLELAQLGAREARLVSEDSSQYFRLERSTGRLTVRDRIDREELCGQALTCTVSFELLLANPLQFFRIEVAIEDINDHSPVFPEEQVTFKILETSDPDSRFPLEGARDLDIGSNSLQAYSIAPENEYFSVSFQGHSEGDNSVELVLQKLLDREEKPEVTFSLIATDGGSPPRSGTTQIRIVVLDANDNAPVFAQKLYRSEVLENAPKGSLNGKVFVLRPLDYEQVRQVEVVVSAADSGSPPRSANVTVRIVVLDENDNAPVVLHPAQDSSPASSELVPTWAEAGYLVTKVVAVDADSGQNSWLSYHLLKATEPGLFGVGTQSGEVRLKRPLSDRDAVKQKLVVLVRDNGRPPLSATAVLGALLLDGFSDAHMPRSGLAADSGDDGGSLTLYLIVSLALVSLLFLASAAAFVACKVCKRKALKEGTVLYGPGDLQSSLADAVAAGTLPRAYCYEVSLSAGSGSSEFMFLKPLLASLPPQHCGTGGGAAGDDDFPGGLSPAEEPRPQSPGTLPAAPLSRL
ncbi:PCDBD protein, partial [Crypturellus soui]|nr:PCDBD protein [Crypturellus soui]